jgi:hypothetical protein
MVEKPDPKDAPSTDALMEQSKQGKVIAFKLWER